MFSISTWLIVFPFKLALQVTLDAFYFNLTYLYSRWNWFLILMITQLIAAFHFYVGHSFRGNLRILLVNSIYTLKLRNINLLNFWRLIINDYTLLCTYGTIHLVLLFLLPLLFEFLDKARFVFKELFVSFVVDVIYGVYIELNVSQLTHPKI